jgi:hypothetical protein
MEKPRPILYIKPEALERCFLVANILEQVFERPNLEYGLIGLARKDDPLHVVATPLLPGQYVNAATVFLPGHNVFRLRSEMANLSKRLGPLLPIAFIHRHLGGCLMSSIDDEFLPVLADQVSTAFVKQEFREILQGEFDCDCIYLFLHHS